MRCWMFLSYLSFQNLQACTPKSSSRLWGLIRTDEYTTDDFIRGREVSEIWTSLRVVVARGGKTAYEPRRSYNIHSGLTCHSVKKGKSCQGAVPLVATSLPPTLSLGGGIPLFTNTQGSSRKGTYMKKMCSRKWWEPLSVHTAFVPSLQCLSHLLQCVVFYCYWSLPQNCSGKV
jgi:hypothetical protein